MPYPNIHFLKMTDVDMNTISGQGMREIMPLYPYLSPDSKVVLKDVISIQMSTTILRNGVPANLGS